LSDKKDRATSETEESSGQAAEKTPARPGAVPAPAGEMPASPAPTDAPQAVVEEALAKVEDPVRARKLNRKEVLTRLLEKNEIILKLTKSNSELDKQLTELKDRWMRAVAEFENYRKRTRREWELLKQQSRAEVILEILGVVDDFERAFAVADEAQRAEFVDGIKLIYNNLQLILERSGVREIESRHQPFDPTVHMAVGHLEVEGVAAGVVAEVVQKGYRIEETVLRPVRVIVAK